MLTVIQPCKLGSLQTTRRSGVRDEAGISVQKEKKLKRPQFDNSSTGDENCQSAVVGNAACRFGGEKNRHKI